MHSFCPHASTERITTAPKDRFFARKFDSRIDYDIVRVVTALAVGGGEVVSGGSNTAVVAKLQKISSSTHFFEVSTLLLFAFLRAVC
jgi:hypothetical protein